MKNLFGKNSILLFLDGPSLLLVDPTSIDLLNVMETKALISMLDFIETESDQDATDKLLVRKNDTRFILYQCPHFAIIYLFYSAHSF